MKLNPGDEAVFKLRLNNFDFNVKRFQKDVLTGEGKIDIMRGITKCLFIDFRGPIGRGTLEGGHGDIGWLKSHLAVEYVRRANVLPMIDGKKFKFNATNIDNLTGITLEHPTEHSQVVANE